MSELVRYRVKFFGTREHKGQIQKQDFEIEAHPDQDIQELLLSRGWQKVNGLKVRQL